MKIDRASILLLSWNGRHHLEECLPALLSQLAVGPDQGVEIEVLVLDNGSTDGTSSYVREHHPEVRLIRSDVNLGFCGGNNRLASEATGDVLILLNDDTKPHPNWLASLLESARHAEGDVAVVSGLILDWTGERLDFGRGLMTFDGHAFQDGYRRPLEQAKAKGNLPAAGDELLFACGGNMLVRRDLFEELGGFDETYFAYLEDVDLGWRLWSAGWRIVAAPEAIVHHRSMATSHQLGNANRGFLFERNAFLTVYKNLDPHLFPRLMPAVWLTLVHRTQTLLVQNNLGGELLTLDPYAGLIANTASPSAQVPTGGAPAEPVELLFEPGTGGPPETSLVEKWRGYGAKEFFRRALRKACRRLLPSFLFENQTGTTHLTDPRTVAQLQAITWLLSHLDATAESRRAVQARRRRSDEEIFKRFPLALVATYPGDERLFETQGFVEALGDLDLIRHQLDELMATD